MRKIAVIGLFLLVLAGGVNGMELDLSTAIRLGLENSLDIQLAQLRVDEAQSDLNRFHIVGTEEEIEKGETALQTAQENLANAQEDLISSIERSYYDLLKAQKRLTDQTKSYEDAQNNFNVEKARHAAGLISDLNLMRAENTLLNSKRSLANQADSVQTSQYRFNELLGLALETQWTLAEEFPLVYQPLEITFEEAIDIARVHSSTMINALESLEKAQESVRLADNAYTPATTLHKARLDLERAEINYAKAENRLFFDLRSAYLKIKDQEVAVYMAQRELEYSQNNLAIVTAQHREGVASDANLQTAKNSLDSAQTALQDAIWEYIRSRRDFLRVMGQPESLREVAR